jgi:DNA helicase-2/ATP-dependent DNA helicase PcrA
MNEKFLKAYKSLNEQQKEAVDNIDGPVFVIAGPGTGKTQIISVRIANILKSTDVSASNILCLTFTDAAATNMRHRLQSLIGSEAYKVNIFTFHGFGANIIQQYPEYFQDKPIFKQIDQLLDYEILKNLFTKLPHTNPLHKQFNDDFIHLGTVSRSISWFKQAGLSPSSVKKISTDNISFYKAANKLISKTFDTPPSSKRINDYIALLKSLESLSSNNVTGAELINDLSNSIDELDETSRYAKPITKWRDKWLTQTKQGEWRFSDLGYSETLEAVAEIYKTYEEHLTKNGLFSFDDMILRAIEALETNLELKLTLQEKYQYLLVDEYQDTNTSQDKLIRLLSDNPVNEGKPNLMVVGDDDQAIYRFQGADNSAMSNFIATWPSSSLITLARSYRSGQSLLDLAQKIASYSNSKNKKELVAESSNKTILGQIHGNSESDQYFLVAKKIKDLIKAGEDPSSITVLAPKHAYLEKLSGYLNNFSIPTFYERREEILSQPHTMDILNLIELANAFRDVKVDKINSLLPMVIAAEYWNLDTNEWWEIALRAKQSKGNWLKAIEKNSALADFIDALKEIAKDSQVQSYELTLAQLLGNSEVKLPQSRVWLSPWWEFYFNEDSITKDPQKYLDLVDQIDTLKSKFRDYHEGFANISDFIRFINLYRTSNIPLLGNNTLRANSHSVNLMTAYRAKGLEWQNVIILNSQDDVWGPQTRNRNLSFRLPSNLTYIQPASETSEDLVRLFYVAITRARRRLYIASYEYKDNAKPSDYLRWLSDDVGLPSPEKNDDVIEKISNYKVAPIWHGRLTVQSNDLTTIFKPVLDNYKLSATHLNDFLNLRLGGPKYFMLKHIFKVPDLTNANIAYGNAIHRSLEYLHKQYKATNELVSLPELKKYFLERMELSPLSETEMTFYKSKGSDHLAKWYKSNVPSLSPSDISEYNFDLEGVVVGDARLTGKVDLLRSDGTDSLIVIDYKTGQPLLRWSGHNAGQAVQGHSYERQLIFYKLLVENSSTFSNKFSVNKGIVNFITPYEDKTNISLEDDLTKDKTEALQKLISKVWNHITNLDIPDTSNYSPTLKGIKEFEQDLIEGVI